MAKATMTVTLRIKDMDRFRLFVWELRSLTDRMRVEASPHAPDLERILDRWTEGGDDEHEGDGE